MDNTKILYYYKKQAVKNISSIYKREDFQNWYLFNWLSHKLKQKEKEVNSLKAKKNFHGQTIKL